MVHLNMVLMGHFLLIFIIKLTAITLTEQGKFRSDCPSNKHTVVCIKNMYALNKSILGEKKEVHHLSSSLIPLCVRENKNATQGPICDELLS